jgi:hypothetical protein
MVELLSAQSAHPMPWCAQVGGSCGSPNDSADSFEMWSSAGAYDHRMPRRTTEFQTIVHFFRQQMAVPGVTVTESKFLHDAVLNIEREVDVVIEGNFDGEPITTSIEVVEQRRPASVTWVEQQVAKHRHLPTTRLVLVAKAGFTGNALKKIAAEGG